jgi:hypothetical protein
VRGVPLGLPLRHPTRQADLRSDPAPDLFRRYAGLALGLLLRRGERRRLPRLRCSRRTLELLQGADAVDAYGVIDVLRQTGERADQPPQRGHVERCGY